MPLNPVFARFVKDAPLSVMMQGAKEGCLGRDDTVVFVHTGGLPAVFAYRDDLLPRLQPGPEGTRSDS